MGDGGENFRSPGWESVDINDAHASSSPMWWMATPHKVPSSLNPTLRYANQKSKKKRLIASFLASGSEGEGSFICRTFLVGRDLFGCGARFFFRRLVWWHAVSTLDDRSTSLIQIPQMG